MSRWLPTLLLLTALTLVGSAASAQSLRELAQSTRIKGSPFTRVTAPPSLGGGIVSDPSFEGGTPNASWDEASTNFGTPLCDLSCVQGGADFAPHTGSWWAWFGGIAGAEVGSVSQAVTIPANSTSLSFWLRIPTATVAGNVVVSIDGTAIGTYTQADAATYAEYVEVTIPITAYADGGSHVLAITSTKSAGGDFNAFVDDVTINGTITGPSLSISPTAIDFGRVNPGETSDAETIEIENNGTEAVTISSITGSGAPFTVDQAGTDLTLDPGQSTTITVTYSPTAGGVSNGTITVTSNAAGSPATINLTGTGAAAPDNDDFADAQEVSDGTTTGSNVDASLEDDEVIASCAFTDPSASVWFVYTATATGLLTVDLGDSDFDTVLSLHNPDGTEFACNEDEGGIFGPYTSLLENVPVEADQEIYIRVDGYDEAQGNISMDISLEPGSIDPPANDDMADAIAITANGTYTGTNVLATEEAGELEASCQELSGTSVWWTFTPASAGTVSIDLGNSDFDTVLSIYQPMGTELDCDDDGSEGDNPVASILTDVPVAANQPVYIRVGGYDSDSGSISFTFNFTGVFTAGENGPSTTATSLTASPNPVRGTAVIRLSVETAQEVTVAVYDVTGRQVATLFQGAIAVDQPVELALNATALPSGVYMVRAHGEGLNLTQRVTVTH